MKKEELREFYRISEAAFEEDCVFNDVTSSSFTSQRIIKARIKTKEKCLLCGVKLVKLLFLKRDRKVKVKLFKKDADSLNAGDAICEITGPAVSVLSVERIALNFLSFLSAIATTTDNLKKVVSKYWKSHPKPILLDTRKTVPGMRYLSKYAVRCGGGKNHRMNLREIAMIKDNHIAAVGIDAVLKKIRRRKVIIEADNLRTAEKILKGKPYVLLCDNFTPLMVSRAIKLKERISPATLIEISGGINEKSVKKYANLSVSRISAGSLTHSAGSIDFSLEVFS